MLYETLSQPKIFFLLLIFGFLSGFIFDSTKLLNYFFNNNKISNQILLFFSSFLSFVIFTECNLWLNYGDIRFFSFLGFFLGLSIQRLSIGKLLAKFMDRCYNFIVKCFKKVLKYFYGRKKKENNQN